MLRVIFFDAVGTLIRLPKGPAWHYCDVARRHGLEMEEETVAAAFRAVWSELPPPPVTRRRREDDAQGWWKQVVHQVLERASHARSRDFDEESYFAELYREFARAGVWEAFPDVGPALRSLAGRYRLGVISNFDGRLREVLDHLQLSGFFSDITISSEVGADKPDPWVFMEALRKAGAAPEEALHVGDEPAADWEGAAQMGLRVFKLDRPHMSLGDLVATLESEG